MDQALEALTRAVKNAKREGAGLEPLDEMARDYNTDTASGSGGTGEKGVQKRESIDT